MKLYFKQFGAALLLHTSGMLQYYRIAEAKKFNELETVGLFILAVLMFSLGSHLIISEMKKHAKAAAKS